MPSNLITIVISFLPIMTLMLLLCIPDFIINPISYIINFTGHVALLFIILALMIPRLQFLMSSLNRKVIGLSSFAYLSIHMIIYFLDNNFEIKYIKEDLLSLAFIQIGYIAFILYLPLVVTSNEKIKKYLGNTWRLLHKLIYGILILSLLHYYLLIKADFYIISLYLLITLFVFYKSSKMIKHGS